MDDITALKAAQAIWAGMTPEEQQSMKQGFADSGHVWKPQVGPQTEAFGSEADIVFYGGAAGGGKTDLAIGLALTKHTETLLLRRESTQLKGVIKRMTQILGGTDGLNRSNGQWRIPDSPKTVDLGHCKDSGDEEKYQGQPHDLIVFDEITHFLESMFRFIIGWNRSVDPGQRCRVLCTGNPPTSSDGDWVREFWGPWLDDQHKDPALPGELRWYATIDGEDYPVPDGRHFVVRDDQMVYDFDPADYSPIEIIRPQSRTFIPAKVQDNAFLRDTSYISVLQSLPEPLRSQMLTGDFRAGIDDDVWQVLPTSWVQAAMDRWVDRPNNKGTMDSMGVDVSRGGRDDSVISRRHDDWYDKLIKIPGVSVPDGPTLGAHVLVYRRDACPVHVDAIGVGTSVIDWLQEQTVQNVPVTGSEASTLTDETGTFKFRNMRAELYWLFREALDPAKDPTLALPPDSRLKADLCAPRYMVREGNIIVIESKEDIKKRLGRSTDDGDAVIYASMHTSVRTIEALSTRHRKPQVRRHVIGT